MTYSHWYSSFPFYYFCLEEALKKIRQKQREKIAEIKKKTNYDSTRSLIEKYDDSNSGFGNSVRRQNVPMTPAPPGRFQPQPHGSQQQQQQPQLHVKPSNGNLRAQLSRK
jgi:endoplasmic reticulum junction formation protein lunapark